MFHIQRSSWFLPLTCEWLNIHHIKAIFNSLINSCNRYISFSSITPKSNWFVVPFWRKKIYKGQVVPLISFTWSDEFVCHCITFITNYSHISAIISIWNNRDSTVLNILFVLYNAQIRKVKQSPWCSCIAFCRFCRFCRCWKFRFWWQFVF